MSARSGGTILSNGGEDIIACGICWDTIYCPVVSDPIIFQTTRDSLSLVANLTGVFSLSMNSLIPGQTYHVRAYAANINGVAYGEDIAFSTAGKPFCLANKPQIRNGYERTCIYLSGYVYPASLSTRVTFEFIHTTDDNFKHYASQGPFEGDTLIFIEERFEGFTGGYPLVIPKGTYNCRIKVENSAGIAFSDDFVLVLENEILNY